MKKMYQMLTVLMVLVLGIFLGAQETAASVYDDSDCYIYVGTTLVSYKNCNDVLGDGHVSYDYGTHTLYLNNAYVKGTAGIKYGYDPQGSDRPFTIVAEGNNIVETYDCSLWDATAYGIRTTSFSSGPDLVIKGSGTLNVVATSTDGWSDGIAIGGNLLITDDVTLKVKLDPANSGGVGIIAGNGDSNVQIGGSAKVIISAIGAAIYENPPEFIDGYLPKVKAGKSPSNITVNKVNPSAGVYTSKSYVNITKQKMKKNPMKVKAKSNPLTVKYSKLKKKAQKIEVKKAFSLSGAKGKVTYAKVSGNGRILVSKSGRITLKKGLGKKTYKIKVDVTAAGKDEYLPLKKRVTLNIKVK